jgi:hypothetical protein
VQAGLLVAKEEEDRVLYVLEVDGAFKQAVIVRNGPATEGAGGAGWYVESWAHCDYSELPRPFTDSLGLQIWTDSSGRPAPTTSVQSWRGPEHCSWQSMTFLYLGKAAYVRDPLPELDEYFDEQYDEHAVLPADAIDTASSTATSTCGSRRTRSGRLLALWMTWKPGHAQSNPSAALEHRPFARRLAAGADGRGSVPQCPRL